MPRLNIVCSCILLVIAVSINVVTANGGGKVPVYPRTCVGTAPYQCCRELTNIDFEAICSRQLVIFPGAVSLDSAEAATVMSSLVSSISSAALITDTTKQAQAACTVRNSWSQIGADFLSIQFYFFNKPVPGFDVTFTGGAALFTAGRNVYIVFSGINNSGRFTNRPINYPEGGITIGKTNGLWLSYYTQAFRQAYNDIIADALALLGPGKSLYIAGHSAGGVVSVYAALDLQQKGAQADHVYLFGNSKPGDQQFVNSYMATPVGPRTSAWWNKLDINPVLPPTSDAEAAQMGAAADGWDLANYVLLPKQTYWRIVPADITIHGVRYYKGQCVKVQSHGSTSTFYTACPSNPSNRANFGCGLNSTPDHDIREYQTSIKACAVPVPTTVIHRRRDAFNAACINDVRIDP